MKPPTEVYDDPAAFIAAQKRAVLSPSKGPGKPRRAARDARTDIPRAPDRTERTGLSTYIKAGWFLSCDARDQRRLAHPDGRDTGWCASERAACQKARELCR